ncbi:mitochondrial carrier domain-containing protein [Aspergillus pseudoustus]|uniref:Mitochondrial carrier domain-containing protein n=1 Tax=Aspergillus pseudoustus TaxID=1810923 RepID=A0ABR4JXC7_9EURO
MEHKHRLQQQSCAPSIGTNLLAGGIAGATETIITYPFEFVKTLRQLPGRNGVSSQSSYLSQFRYTISAHGISGIYAGCTALATSNALKASVRFFTFSSTKEWLRTLGPFNESTATVLAGVTAGTSESIVVVTPAEVLKTRMIEANRLGSRTGVRPPSTASMAQQIIEREGIRAFWRGTAPVVGKQAVNSGVRFTTFGMLQGEAARRWPDSAGTVAATLVIGALSGIATVYASMPFDNIKTRIQSATHMRQSMLNCAVDIARREGATGFWRGTTPRLIRLMLSSGITFTVYEQVVRSIG